ncbi:MAG: efflux RND transporter periplasmic adaptor subunit, partial [Actinomycetota bacterium]|nr:efflux RND transporter periplasmic adaptor subunit [Actinomycetota bacterium]
AKAADAKTIEAARTAFGDLSAALIAYADKTKQPVEGKIVAFCPMANKSWVQADGAIANPYYGQSMATCGSSTRKLSATQ